MEYAAFRQWHVLSGTLAKWTGEACRPRYETTRILWKRQWSVEANRDRSVSFCAILFTPTQSKTLRWKKPSIFPEWEPCRRRRDLVFGRFLSCFVDSASNLATRRRNVRDPTGRRAQELGWKKEMCDPSKMHRDMIGFYSSSREG